MGPDRYDVVVCSIDALTNDGIYNRSSDTIINTANKIMGEALPCDECTQARSCMHECSLFQRYINSKGKHWRQVDKWTGVVKMVT